MSVVALVPDDGCGEGVGRGQSAALLPVAGVPLVVHLVRRLFAAGCVDRALISVAADDLTAVSGALDQYGAGPAGAWSVLPTGRDGADAIRAAFAEALARVPAVEVVLVHQVLRALAPPELIERVTVATLAGHEPVVPVLPCSDTVKRLDEGLVVDTPDRTGLRVVQTPQGFPVGSLRSFSLVGARTVPGDPLARRLDTPFDLLAAEASLSVADGAG